jgi:hypothetical protein
MGYTPPGAAGVGGGEPANENKEEDRTEEDRTFLEKISEIPGAIYGAVTGEGAEVEFPDIPEATELVGADRMARDFGFLEALIPNLKIMMVRDDLGKAEVLERSFEGDKRFGGVFADKFNNPMIVWNDKPYYMNKPGFSEQDVSTFIGEFVKNIPAAKFVKGASKLLGIVQRGVPSYGATEVAGQAAEAILTPKTTAAGKRSVSDIAQEVGIGTGIGVGADLAMATVPPVVTAAVRPVLRPLARGAVNVARKLPRYVRSVPGGAATLADEALNPTVQSSKYPLTVGQRGARPPTGGPGSNVTPQLEAEDVIRNAPSTDPAAKGVLRSFEDAQLQEIVDDATTIQRAMGSGSAATAPGGVDVPGHAAEAVQSVVGKRATELKKAASEGYDAVKAAEVQPIMSREGVLKTAEDATQAVKSEMGVTARELEQMPILKGELAYLSRIIKMAGNPRFKGSPLNVIHGYQKSLNRAIGTAQQGSPERLALGKIKSVIDNAVYDGIEEGFMLGDQAVLDQLKDATGLYRQYMGLTGKGSAASKQKQAANRILEKLTDPDATPPQWANVLFGHAKFTPNQTMGVVIDRLKSILPKDEYDEVVALIKDGVLEKAFSGKGKGVTRTNIVNNFEEVFVKQRAIINKLFTPEEIARIRQFRQDVLPTMWAEIKLNPSGTSYAIMSAMARSRILNFARAVPFVKDVASEVERITDIADADAMVRQYVARKSRPLFSQPVAAVSRDPAIESYAGEVPPELQSILDGLSEEAKSKLLGQVDPQ